MLHHSPKISRETIADALNHISPDLPRAEWVKVVFSVKAAMPDNSGRDLARDWSAGGQSFAEKDFKDTWDSAKADGGINAGYLLKLATEGGYKPVGRAEKGAQAKPFGDLQSFSNHPYVIERGLVEKVNGYAPKLRSGHDAHGDFIADPLFNLETGEITGYNRIYRAGRDGKMLAPGTKKTGNAGIIGNLEGAKQVIVAAGFADCLHLHNDTGLPVLNAQDDGNLAAVINSCLKIHPECRIVAVSDNDASGLAAAEKISKSFPAISIAFPVTAKDASEYAQSGGNLQSLIEQSESGPGAVRRFAVKAIRHEISCGQALDSERIGALITAIATHTGRADSETLLSELRKTSGSIGIGVLRGMLKDAKFRIELEKQIEQGIDNALVIITDKGPTLAEQSIAAKTLAEIKSGNIANLKYDDLADIWMHFKEGIWHGLTKTVALHEMSKAVDEQSGGLGYNRNYLDGVQSFLCGRLACDKWDKKIGLLPLKDAVLDLETKQARQYRQDDFFTWKLPFNYDGKADCPQIKAFLLQSVQGDKSQVEILRAYVRAVLTGRADLQRYLELIGEGGTGKGTFIRLICGLVGEGNYVSTDFKSLEASRFEAGRLYGKRLCLVTDAEKHLGSVETLKAITGQDPIKYEEKGRNTRRTDFIFGGLVLIAANAPITNGEYSNAMQRRRLMLPFNARIEKREIGLGKRLESELPGFLRWVLDMPEIEMISALSDTGEFSSTTRTANYQYLIDTNPLAAWLNECVVIDRDAETQVGKKEVHGIEENGARRTVFANSDSQLYPNYLKWCEENAVKPLSTRTFGPALYTTLTNKDMLNMPEITRTQKPGKNVAIFVGIRLRKETDAPEMSPFDKYLKGDSQEGVGQDAADYVF